LFKFSKFACFVAFSDFFRNLNNFLEKFSLTGRKILQSVLAETILIYGENAKNNPSIKPQFLERNKTAYGF